MPSGRHKKDCTCEKCQSKKEIITENTASLQKDTDLSQEVKSIEKEEAFIKEICIPEIKIKSDIELKAYAERILQPVFEKFMEEFIKARQSIINQESTLNLKFKDIQNKEQYLKERTTELNVRLSEKIESFNNKVNEYQKMCEELNKKLEQAKKNEIHIEHKLQQTAEIIEKNKQDQDILTQKIKDIENKEREYQLKLKILNQKG